MNRFSNMLQRTLLVVVGVAAVCISTSKDAAADRTVGGYAGKGLSSTESDCFAPNSGSVTNACASSKALEVSLPVDSGGTKNVTATLQASDASHNVGCQVVTSNAGHTSISTSGGYKYLVNFGTPFSLGLPSVTVPTDGYMIVDCLVDPTAKVHTIKWTP